MNPALIKASWRGLRDPNFCNGVIAVTCIHFILDLRHLHLQQRGMRARCQNSQRPTKPTAKLYFDRHSAFRNICANDLFPMGQ